MPKRTPEETLKALENLDDDDIDAELERALAMSSEERRKALAAAGARLPDLDARVDQLHREIHPEPGDEPAESGAWVTAPPPAPVRSFDRRWVVLLAAALAAVCVGGGAIALGVFSPPKPPPIKEWPDAAPSATTRPAPAPEELGVRPPPASEDKPKPKPRPKP